MGVRNAQDAPITTVIKNASVQASMLSAKLTAIGAINYRSRGIVDDVAEQHGCDHQNRQGKCRRRRLCDAVQLCGDQGGPAGRLEGCPTGIIAPSSTITGQSIPLYASLGKEFSSQSVPRLHH